MSVEQEKLGSSRTLHGLSRASSPPTKAQGIGNELLKSISRRSRRPAAPLTEPMVAEFNEDIARIARL